MRKACCRLDFKILEEGRGMRIPKTSHFLCFRVPPLEADQKDQAVWNDYEHSWHFLIGDLIVEEEGGLGISALRTKVSIVVDHPYTLLLLLATSKVASRLHRR